MHLLTNKCVPIRRWSVTNERHFLHGQRLKGLNNLYKIVLNDSDFCCFGTIPIFVVNPKQYPKKSKLDEDLLYRTRSQTYDSGNDDENSANVCGARGVLNPPHDHWLLLRFHHSNSAMSSPKRRPRGCWHGKQWFFLVVIITKVGPILIPTIHLRDTVVFLFLLLVIHRRIKTRSKINESLQARGVQSLSNSHKVD